MDMSKFAWRNAAAVAMCALTLLSGAQGQERKLTLQEAVDLALRQNHALRIGHYGVEAERQKERIARSSYFPAISNDSSALYITDLQRIEVPKGAFGASPGPIPPSTIFLSQGRKSFQTSGTMLAQPLSQLVKIHDANKVAAADVKISEASLRKTSDEVVFAVHQLYYQLLATQLNRRAAELQITSSSENLTENGEQYKNGSLLEAALVESRADSLEAKQTLLTTDMQISDLTTQLDDVLGLALNTKLELDPNVNTTVDVPAREEALRIASQENPELQGAVQVLSKARAAEAAAKAEYIPDVTGFARYSYQNGVPLLERNFGTFGVRFSYDLFDGGKRRAQVLERKDEVSQAEEDLARIKDEIGVRIATIYNKLDTTHAMVEVAKEYLAARQESARLVDDQFHQGTVLASQRDASHAQAVKAEAGLLEANLAYLLARDELTRVLSRP